MKSNKEMRQEAWTALFQRRWLGRFVWLWLILMAMNLVVKAILAKGCESVGVLTVMDYWAQNFMAHTANAVPPPMPTEAEVPWIFGLTLFVQFILFIFTGITMFAMTRATLRAARGEDESWFAGLLDGFKQPFGMFALMFRMAFQLTLWFMLLIIPGIVAFYRYRFAWRVKSDHPDWTAGQCLAESVRLTAGRKWALFKFDCSYWKILLVFGLVLMAQQIAMIVCMFRDNSFLPSFASMFVIAGFLISLFLSILLPYYMMVGTSVFYREVLTEDSNKGN